MQIYQWMVAKQAHEEISLRLGSRGGNGADITTCDFAARMN
jgi:hypothetical protein